MKIDLTNPVKETNEFIIDLSGIQENAGEFVVRLKQVFQCHESALSLEIA